MSEKRSLDVQDYRSLYNYLSSNYDSRQINPSTNRIRAFERRLVEKYCKGRVLDAGCGTGYNMREGWIGVDLSEGMLCVARSKPVCQGKIEQLPFRSASFDCAVSLLATLNFCDFAKAACEMARVVRAGGIAVISVASIYDNGYGFFEKRRKNAGIREKKTVIEKKRFRLRFLPYEEVVAEFSRNGMELVEFDSTFRIMNPKWGNYDRPGLREMAMLGLERFVDKKLGCMYFFVFKKSA